ncbi:hypothetical protein [Micrococcus sp. NPDC055215]
MHWPPWRHSSRADMPARAEDRPRGVRESLAPREDLKAAADGLRELLTRESDRLRPDTWRELWDLHAGVEALLPAWDRMAAARAAEALDVLDVLQRHLPRAVDAFLAIPDDQKPWHAGEFARRIEVLGRRVEGSRRRLTRVLTSALEAQGELLED